MCGLVNWDVQWWTPNKTWRAKWFELVLKVTDPRCYSMTAADNQWIQKWSGMRWLMIDDTNIRNTLQCKFQLNIPLRLSFCFVFFVILMYSGSNYTSILSGITAKLWQRSSAIKTTITLYRGVDRRQTVLETFQVHYNVLPRLAAEVFLSFQMQCHFQKRAKGFSLTFCWISFKFFLVVFFNFKFFVFDHI